MKTFVVGVLMLLVSGAALAGPSPVDAMWHDVAELVRKAPTLTAEQKLEAVNVLINTIPYRSDIELYGRVERWAGPAEMIDRQGGDCEDYAISKAMVLLMMGMDPSWLYFTVESGIWGAQPHETHMKLTVFLPGDSRPRALDNRSPFITDWFGAPYVTPTYMLGRDGMYAGLPRGKRGQLIAGLDAEPDMALMPSFYEELRQRLQLMPMMAGAALPPYPESTRVANRLDSPANDHLAVSR